MVFRSEPLNDRGREEGGGTVSVGAVSPLDLPSCGTPDGPPHGLPRLLSNALSNAGFTQQQIDDFGKLAGPVLAAHAAQAPTPEGSSCQDSNRRAYDAVCDKVECFADHHSIRFHKELVLALGITMPYHPKFLAGLSRLLDELGELQCYECGQLVPIPDGQAEAFKADVAAALGRRPRLLSETAPADPVELDDLLASLPFDASALVGTCADPVRGHEFDAPEPDWCARAGALGTFRDLAVLGILILTAIGYKRGRILQFLRSVRRMDVLAAIHGDSFEGATCLLSALCDAYVLRATHGGRADTDRTRADTVACLKRCVGAMRDFILSKTLDPIRPDLERVVPIAIEMSEEGAEIFGRLCSDTQKSGHANRKKNTNAETPRLDERFEATRARCEVVRQIGERVRAIADIALQTEEVQPCPVAVKTLDDRGRPTDNRQVEMFRVWPMTVACRTFGKEVKIYGDDVPITDRYIVQHVSTEPFDHGEANETWAVTIGKARVHCQIGTQPVAVQERRHEVMVRFGLPGGRPSHGGLMKFSGTKADLANRAAVKGVDFVAVEELEAAIRFAGLACEISEQTRARYESMCQLLPKGFQRDDKGAAMPRHSQKVKPKHVKGGNPATIPPLELNISEACFAEFVSLAELHKRAGGYDALPTIAAPNWIGWKLRDAAYGFAWSGRPINLETMSKCLDLLQAGWRRLTIQDLRNCLSEEAGLDGESVFVTMQALCHALEKDSDAYRAILGDWSDDLPGEDG